MLQSACDKLFNLKNVDNKVFLISNLLAQKIDMVKNNHMHTAESFVNNVKTMLTPFHNYVVGDAGLNGHNLGVLLTGAFNAADAMSNNNVAPNHMHDLDVNLDGIWQIAHPMPLPDPNMPYMPPFPGMTIDFNMLQNSMVQFVGKDCAHTDFNMLAGDLNMASNNAMCNNYNMPPMPPYTPSFWGMDNFELYSKCLDVTELANVLNTLNTPNF